MGDACAMSLRNIVHNACKPALLPEMIRKGITRLCDGSNEAAAAEAWARSRAQPLADWAVQRHPALWTESHEEATKIRSLAPTLLTPLESRGIVLGGGGAIDLLYFIVRWLRPGTVLETGVAAGWSSCAILQALERNQAGHLKSSDFPYFRIENPERYIGLLVPDALKHRWTLAIRGDRQNLPELLDEVTQVDLVHYDSDKSRPGREWFARQITPFLRPGSVIIWDDIVNNLAFRDRSATAAESYVLDTPNGLVGIEFIA